MPLSSLSLDGRACRVLLVEDHRDTLDMLARIVQRAGCHVHVAEGFHAALDVAKYAQVDVLLTDVELRDGSGWALFQRLRESLPHLRGIALTGHGMPHHVRQSEEAGFDAHLTKPIDVKQLYETLGRALGASGGGPAVTGDRGGREDESRPA